MPAFAETSIPVPIFNGKGKCLSCGTKNNMKRRRYCSPECRQNLMYRLNVRTGLLRALNTRYATFYFTDFYLILDVLPYDTKEIFSFVYRRSALRKPVDDFSRMANYLGNQWWAEKKRTHKRYLATRFLLETAHKNSLSTHTVKPLVTRKPRRIGRSLTHLNLNRKTLDSPELLRTIKMAYRREAKAHHPDHGGDAEIFRKIYKAYQQLVRWAENPSFTTHRGVPYKWLYQGYTNQWIKPALKR
ncbi:MAG: J domain-containing protein [Desulfobacterales bacterium]|nr:J domain-containing protein [Desulfobacterales bacterium]